MMMPLDAFVNVSLIDLAIFLQLVTFGHRFLLFETCALALVGMHALFVFVESQCDLFDFLHVVSERVLVAAYRVLEFC